MTKQEYEAALKYAMDTDRPPWRDIAIHQAKNNYIASLEAENAALTLLHTQATDEMLKMQNRVHKLEAEIAQLQADNRSLVEQMNAMALKPNQAIIERHEYDHDNPETYPEKRGFYLCESASGKIELFWSPPGQEWYITEVHDKVYNHFQINAYYTWVKAPKGVKHENNKLL